MKVSQRGYYLSWGSDSSSLTLSLPNVPSPWPPHKESQQRLSDPDMLSRMGTLRIRIAKWPPVLSDWGCFQHCIQLFPDTCPLRQQGWTTPWKKGHLFMCTWFFRYMLSFGLSTAPGSGQGLNGEWGNDLRELRVVLLGLWQNWSSLYNEELWSLLY